jgi:hypothetical protein
MCLAMYSASLPTPPTRDDISAVTNVIDNRGAVVHTHCPRQSLHPGGPEILRLDPR